MAAISSAIVPAGAYGVIIPEERAFDPVTLTTVLTALGSSPHQVVMTSTVMPTAVPVGWTVIRRGVQGEGSGKPLGSGIVTGQIKNAAPKAGRGLRAVVDPTPIDAMVTVATAPTTRGGLTSLLAGTVEDRNDVN